MQVSVPGSGMGRRAAADANASQPAHTGFVRTVNKAMVSMIFRVRAEGQEKLPLEGPQVYCIDHPTTIDPQETLMLADRQDMVRFMTAADMFKVPVMRRLLKWGGAFSTEKTAHSGPVEQSIQLLQEGHGVGIAPAGTCSHDPLRLEPFKPGAAVIALRSGAENVVPISFYVHPDGDAHPQERRAGLLAAATVAGGTVLAAAAAPVLAPVAGVACAALAGGTLAAMGVKHAFKFKNFCTSAQFSFLAKLGGGVVGAVAAGVGGAIVLAAAPALVPALVAGAGVAAGAAVLGLAYGWRHRDVSEVAIGDPIAVEPYRHMSDGVADLTRRLHADMGHMKAAQTGVPYDDSLQLAGSKPNPINTSQDGKS